MKSGSEGGGGKEGESHESMERKRGGDDDDEMELEEVTHGGFIDNIVSTGHLLHRNVDDTAESVPPPPTQQNGSGIIDGIVSHLPAAISNGVSPETEEASMLIHSIVHE